MRILILACVVAACFATASLAQTEVAPQLRYETMATGRDYARNYPRAAANAGQEGVAILCCTVREDRTLSCESRYEGPDGWGFGEASLHIASLFKLTAESYAEHQAGPRAGRPLRRVINWQMEDVSAEWEAYAAAVREQTVNICEPAVAEPVA